MQIQGINIGGITSCGCGFDSEQQEIARRLLAYGIKPSGNKSADRAKLREIELKKAKEANCILPDLFTVTKQEQEKIQQTKKEKRIEINPQEYTNYDIEKYKGAKALGEQLYIAIKLKKNI